MKQTKRKRKFIFGRIFDLFIIPIYIVITAIFLFALRNYTNKYVLPAASILLLLLLILIATMFYKKRLVDYIRRGLLVLLCCAMVFGYFKINSFDTFFDDITDNEDMYVTTKMNLYSLQSNAYFDAVVKEYNDIEGKTIGIQTLSDKNASQYVIDQLGKDFKNIEIKEYKDYSNMLSDLTNGYIDVAVINDAKQESLEETMGLLSEYTIALKSYTHKEKVSLNQNDLNMTENFFTIFISGMDEAGVPTDSSLSDVNMLLFINPTTHQVITVSIPRDAYLPNVSLNNENDKLTQTGWDGLENTVATVENAFDVKVDFSVKISFSSLMEVVDALGGIEVDVPIYIEEQDENRSFDANDMIYLQPGVQEVNGKQALAFARHRYGYVDGDLGRNRAQQQIIKSIIKKCFTPSGIASIDTVLQVIPKYTLTNFSSSQLKSFVKQQVDTMPNWQISSLSLSDITDGEEVTATAPNSYAYVCYLAKYQVEAVHAAYTLMKETPTLDTFGFELDMLYQDMVDLNLPKNVILK